METALVISLLLALLTIHLFITRRRIRGKLPPGSMGLPLIGHTLQLLRAMRSNTVDQWLEGRTKKYGPIWKINLLGKPTVVMVGPAANKFIFTSNSDTMSNEPPPSAQRIIGERSLLALRGDDHRRVRAAVMSFLKPEMLKEYVQKIDDEVKEHLDTYWRNERTIKVMPLMKILAFNTVCFLLFGVESGPRREALINSFQEMLAGILSVPVNLPFTRFNRSLKASRKARILIEELIREKKTALKQGSISPTSDMISCLISIQNDEGGKQITDQEIIDNVMELMAAGHETTSVTMTFFIRLLANNQEVYVNVLEEQKDIAKGKAPGEALTWEDVSKMKYTTRTMLELLRLTPPVFTGFRKVWRDIDYNGYLIPKGWQIMWFAWATHLDHAIFPEPYKFDPSRFDGQTPIAPFTFIPFGAGPRICPGYEFGKLQVLIGMHYIVTKFRWKLLSEEDTFKWEPTPVPNEGLPVQLGPLNIEEYI